MGFDGVTRQRSVVRNTDTDMTGRKIMTKQEVVLQRSSWEVDEPMTAVMKLSLSSYFGYAFISLVLYAVLAAHVC